jgi:DNA-binding GntR family transcriptional regulator
MEKKLSTQEIYECLRSMIVKLEIAPASRVTETQIADYFSVSRTPIRAVLQRLESEGLVSIKPKLGCFIRNIDMMLISHYYDVRVVIENLVLEELTKLKDNSPLKALAQQWHPDEPSFGLAITDDLMQAEENFHLELAKITKNPVLVKYVTDINDNIRVVRRLGFPNAKSVTDTYTEHFKVCDLLLKKKLAEAQFELTDHIRKSQDQASRITLHQLYARHKPIVFA